MYTTQSTSIWTSMKGTRERTKHRAKRTRYHDPLKHHGEGPLWGLTTKCTYFSPRFVWVLP